MIVRSVLSPLSEQTEMNMDAVNSLLDENKKLRAELESANYKINMLTMEVSSLKGTLDMVTDSLRQYKEKAREENRES